MKNGIIKFFVLVALILFVIQKITGSTDVIVDFMAILGALVYEAGPIIIIVGGIYILMHCIF